MRSYLLSLFVGGSLAVVAVPSRTPSFRAAAKSETTAEPIAAREIARIRGHFDSVLVELGGRDLSQLTATQRENRAVAIATLRAYRDRGRFPRNYDFPNALTPYFVDRKTGVLCAVAHLLESSGRRDIVDRVAAANNNVWVGELAADTALVHWLDAQGLTLDEAARIQVPYTPEGPSRPYTTASVAGLGASTLTSVVNLTANRQGRASMVSLAGALAGVGTMGLGFAGMRQDAPMALTALNVGAGAFAVVTSVKSQRRYEANVKARRDEERRRTEIAARAVEATVTPLVSVGSQPSAGLAVQVRF